jgi:glycosyltransferase involved in cell wall biosynthesis
MIIHRDNSSNPRNASAAEARRDRERRASRQPEIGMHATLETASDHATKPMKVLHVIPTVNPDYGGPIAGIFTSSEAMREHGYEYEIVSLDAPTDPWVARCPLPVHPTGTRRSGIPDWAKRLLLVRYGYTPRFVPWLKAHASCYDAVIVHGHWNYASLGSWRALKRGMVPYFAFPHGMLDPYFNKLNPLKAIAKQIIWWIGEGRLVATATGVLFVSEEEKLLAARSFWPFRGRCLVIPYGTKEVEGDPTAQKEAFLAAVPKLAGRDFLLYLGRIHPKKGCDLLIEAFAAIAKHTPSLDLVVAGPDSVGWASALQDRAEVLGIANRVHWPGALQGDRKWGAFRAATAFVLPSHQENFGIVIAEAAACGTPILTTFKVNIWREVNDSGAGLVASDDVAGITEMLDRFWRLSEPDRRRMRACARDLFTAKLDIRAMAPELARALRSR